MDFKEFELWQDQNNRRVLKPDEDEWGIISASLPNFGHSLHCGCGPHSYRSMRLFLREVQPKRLLEIGFNLGHSALFWLRNGVPNLTSVELKVDESVNLADVTISKYALEKGSSFKLVTGDSKFVLPTLSCNVYDASFIDGGHEYSDVMADISGCLQLGIQHLFFDDWLTIYGGVQQAIHDSELHILWISGNQALCTK